MKNTVKSPTKEDQQTMRGASLDVAEKNYIDTFMEAGYLSDELRKRLLKDLHEMSAYIEMKNKFKQEHPGATQEEYMQFIFSGSSVFFSLEDIKKRTVAIEQILQKEKELLQKAYEIKATKGEPSLSYLSKLLEVPKVSSLRFGNNDKQYFGISNVLANPMYRLVDLLEAQLTSTSSNSWEAKGTVQNSLGQSISLVYEFQAPSKEEAEKRVEEYKRLMKIKGVPTWMAFWVVGNEHKSTEYTCPFIEIMKCMSDEDRVNRFEPEERQRCWDVIRVLKRTTIKIERPVRKDKKGKLITRWIEQPLVTILGGEREQDEKYPLNVKVRLLDPTANKKEFAPTLYNKSTLDLHPNDVLLAFIVQTRAAQKSYEDSEFDWDSLFKLGNVEGTAKSNPREARVKVKKKMAHLKDQGIVEDSTENKRGIKIKPKKPGIITPSVG